MVWEGLTPPYATIVADPPWDYGADAKRWPSSYNDAEERIHHNAFAYSAMSLADIAALNVPALAAPDCWLFLWTTNKFLPDAFGILDAWGFRYRQMLVWNKAGASPFGGTFTSNGAEFLIGSSCGSPTLSGRAPGGTVLTSSRPAHGQHSKKPPSFNDLVEATCPGPYVELFARAPRLGWDSWGYGYESERVS